MSLRIASRTSRADYRRRHVQPRAAGGAIARVGAAAVAMVLVAEAAVWLLRPARSADPAGAGRPRATTSRRPRSTAAAPTATASCGSSLAGLARRARCWSRSRSGGRPRSVAASSGSARAPCSAPPAAGAGLSVALGVAALPASIAAHERAVDYGISTQSFGSWLGDVGKSAAIGAVLAAAGGALLIALVRRFGGRWWLPGTVRWRAIAAVFVWLAPVVLAPLFNKFTPLPANSQARAEVLSLARRAGVDIGEVYRVNASRRVRSLNAYVDGIGPTKRVVLYDNLLAPGQPPRAARASSPTSSATSSTTTCPAGSPSWSSSRRSGCCSRASSAARSCGRTGVDRAGPGGAARLLARARRRRARPRGAREPALAPGRGERRHLRPPADPRSPRR